MSFATIIIGIGVLAILAFAGILVAVVAGTKKSRD